MNRLNLQLKLLATFVSKSQLKQQHMKKQEPQGIEALANLIIDDTDLSIKQSEQFLESATSIIKRCDYVSNIFKLQSKKSSLHKRFNQLQDASNKSLKDISHAKTRGQLLRSKKLLLMSIRQFQMRQGIRSILTENIQMLSQLTRDVLDVNLHKYRHRINKACQFLTLARQFSSHCNFKEVGTHDY
ncbi:hypothetical protein FGO68_gene16037 [Halteria grandinella]|uniref:Uncharacterized protein n=1 Tax=Halteria grandinella TaxID=5974 RepID=A0A8J8NVB2_HALGN|nr:hypothetical protein FGO68_gene16037 [Halteria grandinella]